MGFIFKTLILAPMALSVLFSPLAGNHQVAQEAVYTASSSAVEQYTAAQTKNELIALGIDDPYSYTSQASACVGCEFNQSKTALYVFVFFPTGGYFNIESLKYYIGTRTDEYGVFVDLKGGVEWSIASVTEKSSYEGGYGSFSMMTLNDGTIASRLTTGVSDGKFRINIHGVSYTDEGLTKTQIAQRRNFQGCQSIYDLNTGKMVNIYDKIAVVGNHYEGFQLFNTTLEDGIGGIKEVNYSCFSFAYDDYDEYGQLEKVGVSYDQTEYKGQTNFYDSIDASNLFKDKYNGLPSNVANPVYSKKTYDVYKEIENQPLSVTYQTAGFLWFRTQTFQSNTIQKTAEIVGDGYNLSSAAKSYQYVVIFDTRTFYVTHSVDLRVTIGDFSNNQSNTNENTFLYVENFSYITFWFSKNGIVTELKAFDDKVKDTSGNVPLIFSADWLANVLKWINDNLTNLAVWIFVVFVCAVLDYVIYKAIRSKKERK